MNFRLIKNNIVSILGAAESGRYTTVGYQRQTRYATTARTVQVFFCESEFKGALNRPVSSDLTFRIELTVSAAAEGNLSVINDPSSSSAQVSAALLAFQESAAVADADFDELAEIIYQTLMDGDNYDLGFAPGVVANRWIGGIKKDAPLPRGEFVTITGGMLLTCRTVEALLGAALTPGYIFDTTIDIDGDDVEKTGVTVDRS